MLSLRSAPELKISMPLKLNSKPRRFSPLAALKLALSKGMKSLWVSRAWFKMITLTAGLARIDSMSFGQ